ncbi:MAG: hypothetical protein JXP34_15285, partial [Planctomycetes bacterium]|nr:hypothetical protein [Planctomycetota bacterium]
AAAADPRMGAAATSLAERARRPIDRTALAVRLIPGVLVASRRARIGEHARAIARWTRRSDLLNRAVRVRREGRIDEGIVDAIDPFRGLRIRAAGGAIWIRDTEVDRVELA